MSDFVFSTATSSDTFDLYATDGTSAGSVDLGLNLEAAPKDFTIFDNKLFFVGTLPAGTGPAGGSLEPVIGTNGTAAGTQTVPFSSGVVYPDNLDVVDGRLVSSGAGAGGRRGHLRYV